MDVRNPISAIAVLGALFGDVKSARDATTFVSVDAKSYMLQEEHGRVIGHADDIKSMRVNKEMVKKTGKEPSRRSIILYFAMTAARKLLVTIAMIKDKKATKFTKHQVNES